MWTHEDDATLALIKDHTLNGLRYEPQSVNLNDKLWLIRKIEELLAALQK